MRTPLPLRLFVQANQLTAGGALLGKYPEAIQNLLQRERGFAIVPSDTCYSLAAIPTGLTMSRRINQILSRDEEPIALAFDGIRRVSQWVKLNFWGYRILEALTPGALTVVCPLNPNVDSRIADDVLAAPDRTLGVRIPDSKIEAQLVEACGSPITTVAIRTLDTKRPVTDLEQATEIVLAGIATLENPPQIAIIEAGQGFAPYHSTVIRVPGSFPGVPYEMLRTGAIPEDQIRQALEMASQWEIADYT